MQVKEKPTEQYYVGSVLLSDHIKSFVEEGLLIVSDPFYEEREDTFDERQLDRSKYNARLGKAYYKAGKFGYLDEKSNPHLVVESYELVFVESYEVFKLPENVVARYDLRISGCLGGMGLQTGLQIDPTYYGRFFCPLFNFSDSEFRLKYKDHLASVEFLYTTPPTAETKPYGGGKQELFSLSQTLLSPRRSGLGRLWAELESFDRAATRLHTRVDAMMSAVFEGMAFMIAALGIIVAAIAIVIIPEFEVGVPTNMSLIIRILIGIAIALGIALGMFFLMRKAMRKIQ